jgi:alpha-1,6-mannosyltransferase
MWTVIAGEAPDRALDALEDLRDQGVDAVLVFAGNGPWQKRLSRRAEGQPVHFLPFISERADVAALLATADVVLATGPIETFGLAALEALACGTPVVADMASALPEVIANAGVAVPSDKFFQGVLDVLSRPEPLRRAAARRRAEDFG